MLNDSRIIKVLKTITYGVAFLTLSLGNCHAKVDPPNYDFTLSKFEDFMPGKKFKDLEAKWGKPEVVKKAGGTILYRYQITHVRYKFPLVVQVVNGEINDFMATLPSYFLHNVFHQSLINKYGPQDKYYAQSGVGVYIWNNEKLNKVLIYEGGCSVTCHPISFSAKNKIPGGLISVHDQLSGVKKP